MANYHATQEPRPIDYERDRLMRLKDDLRRLEREIAEQEKRIATMPD